jgi:diadenosine tetraphosphate (Ap4A) HIT family hydrolase
MKNPDCPLCQRANEHELWRDDFCRVIWVDEPDYPGFCRVILNHHVREMTDLAPQDRRRLMDVVFAVEAVVRTGAAARTRSTWPAWATWCPTCTGT